MKLSSYFKIASALLTLSVFAGCASLPVQQGEYDDVYFSSADRTQPKKVIIDPKGNEDLGDDVVTLQKSSDSKVEAQLIDKYNNGTPSEVVYFQEIDPRVGRASELNYNDFVWDYDHELLKNYDLPLDWDDMDAITFNRIIRNDFSFRNAWYEQYYRGNLVAMDNYLNNPGISSRGQRNLNINVGLGFGFGSFYSPFSTFVTWNRPIFNTWNDPFYMFSPYYSYSSSFWYNPFDPFYNPFGYYSYNSFRRPWRYGNNWYNAGYGGYYNPVIIVNNNGFEYNNGGRNFTRSSRLPSTSITSVRSDAANGSGRTRSTAALENATRTRSTISSGRVSNTSVRPNSISSGTRSSRSVSSVDAALSRSSRRVNTDVSRSSTRSSANYSISSRRGSPSLGRYAEYSRSTSSSRVSIPSYTRNSSSRSGVSFTRNTSSRSSSGVFSGRSSSSREIGFSRSSGSSSRSSGPTFGRSSSSSSRSSGSGMRSSGSSSSGSSRSSGSSSGSTRSSSSSSGSRGGRGN